ncbi:sodium:solute symporter family protein [Virgibacillus pantothenticus]|uniref:sodium:solute symporter family protein n=1 Tax=Virgibacillus pantothenticus TaxID=1473 RepID=UPI000984549D|nr:sodium:solute symporter family protein [Virgibacillus pantothenticus]
MGNGNLLPILLSSMIIIGLSAGVSLYVGMKRKGNEEWAVGGRSLPLYVVIGTQFATVMGGGMLVAHVGIGYTSGWSTITYGLILGGGILTLLFLANWLREQGFTTLPDVIRKIYGEHPLLTSITTVMAIIVPFGWIGTQMVAFGSLLGAITGMNENLLMFFLALISLVYILPSGMTSIAWTDFIFGICMLMMSVVSIGMVFHMTGGFDVIASSVPPSSIDFPTGMGAIGSVTILLWALSILPGTMTNQMYYQRIYAAKSSKTIKLSLIITVAVILLVEAWAAVMGMGIRTLNPGLANPEDAAGWFLTQVPTWFLALFTSFIIVTIMSTVNSGAQSVVVNLTKDIYQNYINPSISEKSLLRMSRVLSVIVIAVAYVMATLFSGALNWLVATYAYSAGALLFPIFIGYALRKTSFLTVQGGIAGMICGLLGTGIGHALNTGIPYVIFGLGLSLIGLLVGSYFTKEGQASSMEEQVSVDN